MSSTDSGVQEQRCPRCGRAVATAGLEPFTKISCPGCGFQLRVERVFKNYFVLEPLGTGGMGSVYKARDARLNRFVALKLLRKEFAGDENLTAKLQEEARLTASIKHPHVVEVFATGEEDGQFYVVMELVDGGSLDDRMEDEKRISEKETLEIGLQVAKGLQAALQAGLIHRDIKPGNILFAARQTAKIVDFGLAQLAVQHAQTEGEIWGTPYYVAPERLTSQPEDFRSDVYSLGATLFHALAGRPTFENETQSAAELKKLKSNPVGLKEAAPDVSDETAVVIDRMLQPNPSDRQNSYQEVIAQIQGAHAALLKGEEELGGRWSRPMRVLGSLGALLLLAAIGFGIFVGVKYQPQKKAESASFPGAETMPAPTIQAEIESARRELQAGRYAAAETLFRQIAESAPGVQAMAELCAALQLWERGDWAQAGPALQRFVRLKPPAPFGWMSDYKPLAQNRLDDYQLYAQWEESRPAIKEPHLALEKIREVSRKLKAKGTLSFRLADEEAKIVAEVADMAVEEKKRAGREAPRWRKALSKARKEIAAYQFEDAVGTLEKVTLTSTSLQAQRDDALRRARWLGDWKRRLIDDINRTGFAGAVTDIHGVRYTGPVHHATARKLELKTRSGSVMTDWPNLSPQMLLTVSTAFIRPNVADIAERQWLSAIFAAHTGQTDAANDLARKAADAKPEFRDLRTRFFSATKK
jgi:tRNA A-37 threonylcarbamoyl transferase component Bud32